MSTNLTWRWNVNGRERRLTNSFRWYAVLLPISSMLFVSPGLAAQEAGAVGVWTESTGPVAAVSSPAAAAEVAAVAGPQIEHQRGYPMPLDSARALPRAAGPGPAEVWNIAPPPLSAAEAPAPAPALGTQFEGISDTGWIPADPMLAVGREKIIQVVNSTFRITTRTGSAASTSTLSAFFGVPSGSNGTIFDPRIQYDHFAGRFVMLALTTNSARTDSWYLVAVSKSETPTTAQASWIRYHIRSDTDGGTNTASWGDYAPIGFDNTYFYITSNQFSPSGTFLRSKIRRYAKAPFYSGGAVSGVEWSNVTDSAGNGVFTIQPAVTFGVPGHQWLASVPFGSTNVLQLFRITNGMLFKYRLSIGSTQIANPARQKGTATRIDSGDNRLLNAVFSNNRLYLCHTVKSGTFGCAARYLGVNTSNLSGPSIALDRVIGTTVADYYYPAVSCNPAGSSSSRLATVFNFSAPDRYAGITYTQMTASGSNQALGLAREGQNVYVKTYGGARNRWGDYNGIARDPLNSNRFFFNAMYAKSTAHTWGTWVASTTVSTTSSPGTAPKPTETTRPNANATGHSGWPSPASPARMPISILGSGFGVPAVPGGTALSESGARQP